MKFKKELYDDSGCPIEYTLMAENDVDADLLNAIEQWLRNEDDKLIKEAITT